MSKIISVSRRTDIPAFYGDWFINRLKAGFAGYVNPYGGQKYLLPMAHDDVICFVFWSKNYAPFINKLKIIEEMRYGFYFNFTITGLPQIFECNLVSTDTAISTLKELSKMYSPMHINWRYDPIIISDITDYSFHVENFRKLASQLQGHTYRCYFSYAIQYGKVKRNFEQFEKSQGLSISDPDTLLKQELANELSQIARSFGIKMYSCCSDILLTDSIEKAHCIDGNVIKSLFLRDDLQIKEMPTRKECGCIASADIGVYDTCPHGCIYCYANINKGRAINLYENHDVNSAFLGYTANESNVWVQEILSKKDKKEQDSTQLKLF